MKVFGLSNSKELMSKLIDERLGIMEGNMTTKKFSDGEIKVEINESVRGKTVVVLGSIKSSEDIMELMMVGDAMRRSSAREIITLLPYIPYMRQDRKDVARTAIGARVIANMIQSAGFNQVITLDLHAAQIEGFFNIPTTHINGESIFCPFLNDNYDLSDVMIVSPDVGGAKRAKKFASNLKVPLAIINKEREMANHVSSMELIGDVTGKKVIIVDDMVDTAGSLTKAAETLLENGATEVMSCITHGVLSGSALDRIRDSKLTKLYITDSINIDTDDSVFGDKIEVISSSNILKVALNAIDTNQSIDNILRNI